MRPGIKLSTVTITLFFLTYQLFAQDEHKHENEYIEGKVISITGNNEVINLVGANVYWLGTTEGTTTGKDGKFRLKKHHQASELVASFVGFHSDTIDVDKKHHVHFQLDASVSLEQVEVIHRNKSTGISYADPIKLETMHEDELLKAACCNLSESFETNPSVDVTFTDAVTGTREIIMLGLAGPYTQITKENMPEVRGLSALYGLTYIPGVWVESIQLNKGTGSVVNGFESIAGQINIELRKPENMDRLYLNAYTNEGGRIEGNANIQQKINEKWSTAVLLHGNNNSFKIDRNNDGFLDKLMGDQFIGLNRWKYVNNNMRMQFGVKGTYLDKTGGQVAFNPKTDALTTNNWGMQIKTERFEGWTKMGFVDEENPWKSFGFQLSGASHKQNSYYGLNKYDAIQNTMYANLIYQSILWNTNHKFKTGASFQYDEYTESLNTRNFDRTEYVPGGYFEYSFKHHEEFTAVAGIRTDYHNIYGPFITPRLHIRYAVTKNNILRLSGGRGQRTANILSEHNGLLASARKIIIRSDSTDKPYGLDPEVAWNAGINFTHNFKIGQRQGVASFDYYRTAFDNQIVTDLDQNPQEVVFYNLKGRSFSNSFQAQLDYEIIKNLDARLAYRWYDVKTNYNGLLMRKPLIASHRAFLNIGYETNKQWKFDYTINWQGKKRIPFTGTNPENYRLDDYSPDFYLMNAQVSKRWKKKFEGYIGIENILDYRQPNPILSSEQPFSQYFDSSIIWGPVFGRNIYLGLRFWIE